MTNAYSLTVSQHAFNKPFQREAIIELRVVQYQISSLVINVGFLTEIKAYSVDEASLELTMTALSHPNIDHIIILYIIMCTINT